MDWIHHVGNLSTLFSLVCAIFAYVVIRPINKALDNLEKAISKLNEEQKITREQHHRLEGEVRELKYSTQKAHDRIDAYMKEQAQHAKPN